MMYLDSVSFLGISTQQGQPKEGLTHSPQMALSLFPSDWIFTESLILQQSQTSARIKHWDDLKFLCWDIYEQAYRSIRYTLSHGRFQVNWGGDHSIGVATVGAFTSLYSNGFVLWVDAHADLNIPEASPTGNFHGMPVSFLLGLGAKQPPFSSSFWKSLDPHRLIYLGLRDIDPYERKILKELNITAYYAEDLTDFSFPRVIEEIKAKVGHRPLHISFDIDSIDPTEAPSTGVPSPNGLSTIQVRQLSLELAKHCQVKSVDIVEVNPAIGTADEVLRTFDIAINFLTPLLPTHKENNYVRYNQSHQNNLSISRPRHLPLFPQGAV